ncbi:hypothetical protein OG710_14565 [Streptomyces sp. NBC_00525]|nr:hypothetical protein [Streptomyces sp. NBC_00525]WUC94723.1 hypothetical protein OG710_14565 [Streptomyces sp. NBC_00525]
MGGPLDKKVTARHLEDLAQEAELAPVAEGLSALAQAIGSDEEGALDAWCELDLLHHFARAESVAAPEPDRRAGWTARLDWVLGGMVFLPLLFTWLGLAQASSAYGALTGADPKAADRPFLQLWQSGFQGHLDSLFRFGHVALAGCITLGAMLGLALWHGWLRSAADRREQLAEERSRAALTRLVPVLTSAQLLLNAHRFASPQRFAAELNAAAGRVQRMQTKAISSQELLVRAAELVGQSVDKAEQRLEQAADAVLPLKELLAGIDTSVAESGTAIGGAIRELDAPFTEVGRRLTDAVNAQRETLDKSFEELRTNVDEVRASLLRTTSHLEVAITGNGDGLQSTLNQAALRIEDSVTGLTAAQREFTTGLEVVSDLNGQLINRLGTAAQRTGDAADASREAVSGIVTRSKALHEATERFATVADALERAVLAAESAQAGAQSAQAGAQSAQADARSAQEAADAADASRSLAEEALRQTKEAQLPIGPSL